MGNPLNWNKLLGANSMVGLETELARIYSFRAPFNPSGNYNLLKNMLEKVSRAIKRAGIENKAIQLLKSNNWIVRLLISLCEAMGKRVGIFGN